MSPDLNLPRGGSYNIPFLEFVTGTIRPLSLGVFLASIGVGYFLFYERT